MKDKKDEEKDEKKEFTQKDFEEQLDKLLSESGFNKDEVRIITLPIARRTFLYVLLETIYMVIINLVLFLGVNGYFHSICPSWKDVLFASLTFSGFEFIIRNGMFTFWRKNYFKYLFIINIVAIMSSIVLCYFAPFLNIVDTFFSFAISVVIICIIKFFIRNYTFDRVIFKIMNKLTKKH